MFPMIPMNQTHEPTLYSIYHKASIPQVIQSYLSIKSSPRKLHAQKPKRYKERKPTRNAQTNHSRSNPNQTTKVTQTVQFTQAGRERKHEEKKSHLFPACAKIICQISSHCCCLYDKGRCGFLNVVARRSRRRPLRIFSASMDFQSRTAKRMRLLSIEITPGYICSL